jgi:hypothetical protein
MIANKSQSFARKCRLACETGDGAGRSAAIRQLLGLAVSGLQMDGSPFPKRKFVVPCPACATRTRKGASRSGLRARAALAVGLHHVSRGTRPAREERCWATNLLHLKQVNDVERIFGQNSTRRK